MVIVSVANICNGCGRWTSTITATQTATILFNQGTANHNIPSK
jgi:hypothetical protein